MSRVSNRTIFLVFLLVMFAVPTSTEAFTITKIGNTTGLSVWYTFDGRSIVNGLLTDQSGQGNTSRIIGISTTTFYVAGKLGQAFNFDGVDDYTDSNTTISVPTDFSVSWWMKTSQTGGGRVFAWGFTRFAYLNSLIGKLNFTVDGDGTGSTYSTTNINDNKWHHITYVVSGNTQTLYVDGVQEATATETTNTTATSVKLASDYSVGGDYEGLLDDWRLYSRTLSAAEVRGLYNTGAGSKLNASSIVSGPSSGLIGWWTFDGKNMTNNVADSSGQGNHGNLTGQAATTTVAGRLGQALSFDGVNDVVSMPGTADLLDGASAVSFSLWVKPSALNDLRGMVSRYNGGGDGWGIESSYAAEGGNDDFLVFITGNDYGYTTSNYLSVGMWRHAVVVFDGSLTGNSNRLKLYVDGSPATLTFTGTIPAALESLSYLFQIGGYTGSFFNGNIDDVRIYNRAVTTSEARMLYSQGVSKMNVAPSGTNLTTGLVGYWTFDGKNMTSNVADSSGQGNHGNLSGQAATTTASGKLGQSLRFDGTNDYVIVGNESAFDFERTDPFTISMWLKPTVSDTTIQVPFSKGADSSPYQGISWVTNYANTGTNAGHMTIMIANNIGSNSLRPTTVSATNLNDGSWHHYTLIYDGSSVLAGVRLYQDGVSLALNEGFGVSTLTDSILTNSAVSLGARSDGAPTNQEFYNGLMDDVRVYNRALTATEAKMLYNQGATR
jgi:hypothetical protein